MNNTLSNISNLRKIAIVLMVIGAFLGLGQSESAGLFYNILIMPAIGILGYFVLRKNSYTLPVILFVFVYTWHLIKYTLDSTFANESLAMILIVPLNWSLIFSGLCALGIVIAFLLHFAFKKDDEFYE